MTKKKIIIIIAVVLLVVAAIAGGIIYYQYKNRFIYNEEGALGNTTGNLYNGGRFCVYQDRVYFANPNDGNALYSMKEDGTDLEKINTDRVSHLNICNDYIYYVKGNLADSYLSVELSNAVCRQKIGDKSEEVLRNDLSDSLLLCGNELFYRGYGTNGDYFVYKINTDGKTPEKLLFKKSYQMLDYMNGKIYFANVEGDHNLMYYDVETGSTTQCVAGNFYMPDFEGEYIYYIDLDNHHALTRMQLAERKPEVLSDDWLISYNYNAETGEIYYQAENSADEHMLCKVNVDGTGREVIRRGDFCNINFTKEYVYFAQFDKESDIVYRMPLDRSKRPELFAPGIVR